ncbi:PadR family transcriptional regulator [Peribacillus sp. RS7]|jgi:DNA-binding PadR family transcriptional regulator|uniref:PadR family transcriptional regulator n=1 Tax=unclassified Peribacillus TaxID=2675266 RepID=UPI0025A1A1DC|nr:PadR family transcriptional regulator [Peribacillus sp. ACCC06369]MDM5360709.1 PadR family transcriptional regulator [Peribacillus sp. ACCC06369]
MPIQIFILSKLMEDNNYPYKLKKQLSEPIPMDRLGGLTESKLYYHFDSLAKKGLVEAVEIIKEEHRPDKQVFAITAKGREELPKLIYKLFENADEIKDMVVGLANLKYVDRDEVLVILKRKSKNIRDRWEQIKDFEQQIQIDEGHEKFIEFMSGYVSTRTEHTIYWLEELINRINQGEI